MHCGKESLREILRRTIAITTYKIKHVGFMPSERMTRIIGLVRVHRNTGILALDRRFTKSNCTRASFLTMGTF